MSKKILYVSDGAKGGVGKSLVATVIGSLLLANHADTTFIETDPAYSSESCHLVHGKAAT
jgi:MinD-like ATPase involved in chromosome partitioning or flagellar assembly